MATFSKILLYVVAQTLVKIECRREEFLSNLGTTKKDIVIIIIIIVYIYIYIYIYICDIYIYIYN